MMRSTVWGGKKTLMNESHKAVHDLLGRSSEEQGRFCLEVNGT